MSNIIFLTGSFFPEADANVTCSFQIMSQLKAEGHDVSCICGTAGSGGEDYINGIPVYRVAHKINGDLDTSDKCYRLKKLGRFIKKMFLLPCFPNVEPSYSKAMYKKLEEVACLKKPDCVIGVFRPFATVKAAMLWKKHHPETKVIGYYLDVLKGAVKPDGMPLNLYNNMCDDKETCIFRKLDLVLMAENGRKFYDNNTKFAELKNIKYVNFPTLIFRKINSQYKYSDVRTFVYAGYIDRQYRNPLLLIEILKQLQDRGNKIRLDFYGSSNMENELIELSKLYCDWFKYHGKVSKEEADEAIAQADFLVNIANDISGIVASKTFELFATGKPIIHFSNPKLDSSLPFFNSYPEALIINKSSECSKALVEVEKFINERHEIVSQEYLEKEYYSATPMATTKYIREEIFSDK